jgi:hypothetical protein
MAVGGPPVVLILIDLLPMADPVQGDLAADDIVADTIRPDLKTPLADAFPLELLDLGRRTEGICFETLEGLEDFLLDGNR